jgi:hypothetical protein
MSSTSDIWKTLMQYLHVRSISFIGMKIANRYLQSASPAEQTWLAKLSEGPNANRRRDIKGRG